MSNTKVQHCWETPSQHRSCGLDVDENSEDEKPKVRVGNKSGRVGTYIYKACVVVDYYYFKFRCSCLRHSSVGLWTKTQPFM